MEFTEDLSFMERERSYELAQGVAETAQTLFSAGSVIDTLDSVVATAVATIDGCDWAGIFLFEGDVVVTPASTDPIVMEADSAPASLWRGALPRRHHEATCFSTPRICVVILAGPASQRGRRRSVSAVRWLFP